MMPHSHAPVDNNVMLLITSFIIQAGIWIADMFGNITFSGVYDTCYDFAKLGALIVSMWASYRVAKKHKS